jgi:hypothetical protein
MLCAFQRYSVADTEEQGNSSSLVKTRPPPAEKIKNGIWDLRFTLQWL